MSKLGTSLGKMDQIYEAQADFCKALSHPVRLKILDILASGECSNSHLLEILSIPKANLSQHLNILQEAGIVETQRDGTGITVRMALEQITDACSIVRSMLIERLEKENIKASYLKKQIEGIV